MCLNDNSHNLKKKECKMQTNADNVLTAPSDICETGILSLFASFYSIETLIPITLLIRANVTFQGVACDKNIIENNKG